jgi:5'-deoxynucleotidase YfbR-like HD superfamily hydrolase
MRLVDQIKEALAAFAHLKTPPALIGGLALTAYHVIRATEDVDFLADADALDTILRELGYQCLYRSEDAANYMRGDEGMDFLFAHRPIAINLLRTAKERDTGLGRLRVVSAEGLIGFKLQACVNNPKRTQDIEDIRSLLRTNRRSLNMDEVRQYFRLFEREALLNEIITDID